MILVLLITSLILYSFLAVQDFRDREFYVLLIPALLISNSVFAYLSADFNTLVFFLKANSVFIVILCLSVYAIMSFKNKSLRLPLESIGLGDILILLTLIPLFSPEIFRLVFISAGLSGLMMGIFYKRIRPEHESRIPLAGLIGLCCAALLLCHQFKVLNIHTVFIDG